MRQSNRRKRNYIIAGLCMILLIMVVGYAAFSSQLKISGTSSISSSWNIQITNIETMLPSDYGSEYPDGYNISEPTYTPTSATFNAGFELPGSIIGYIVEISNLGSIDGQVTIGNLSCGDNSAILCMVDAYDKNPMQEEPNNSFSFNNGNQDYSDINFALKTGEKHYIMVMVGYADVTEQPVDLDTNIKLDLTYEQYVDIFSPSPSGETTLIGGQEVNIIKYGDGLYKDKYENGRYIYKGTNPNNYIMFNDELWRIIAKEADGTYKIVNILNKNKENETNRFDDDSNDWSTSEVANYLNNDYYNSISTDSQKHIVNHNFYDGAVSTDIATTISTVVSEEKSSTWNGKIGLINVSDYMKIYLDNKLVENTLDLWDNSAKRASDSYLTGIRSFEYEYNWTINKKKDSKNEVIIIFESYDIISSLKYKLCTNYTEYLGNYNMNVVLYLSPDIILSGSGTEADPYTITN